MADLRATLVGVSRSGRWEAAADLVVENTEPAEARIADPAQRKVLLRQALGVDLDAQIAAVEPDPG